MSAEEQPAPRKRGRPPKKAPNQVVTKVIQDAIVEGFYNPAVFARYFLDVDPYEAQEQFLIGAKDATEANFVAGNRVGKSLVSGVLLLWKAFYRHIAPHRVPERPSTHVSYKAVSTSLTLDQAKLAWDYARTFAECPRFKPRVRNIIHSPFPEMHIEGIPLANGDTPPVSEVWARSLSNGARYLLGHSLSFILVDEAAYVRNYLHIEDEVLRMRLADQGGSLVRISTPNGRNWFADKFAEGMKGDPRIFSMRVSTWDNPYISRAVLNEAQERMTPEMYQQNVLGEFVSLSDFFRLEDIQALYTDQDYTLPVAPARGAVYAMGVDLGAARDPTVVIVWRVDKKPYETVFVGSVKNPSWRYSREFVKKVYQEYRPAQTFIDATGNGKPIAQQLTEEDGLENVEQFVFSISSKPEIMTRLQDAAQRRVFVFPYVTETKTLVHQLSFYRLDDKALAQDFPIALALVNAAAERLAKDKGINTEIYEDLAFITSFSGGRDMSGIDVFGPGTIFRYDERNGLFLPNGEVLGDELLWDG